MVLTPVIEYRTFLFDKMAFSDSPQVQFLKIIRPVINYYILFQVFVYLVKNFRLIRKYGDRAEQFYSDIRDGKYNNASTLNNMIVYNSATTIVCYLVFNRYSGMVFIFQVIYAVVAYMIGYMGYKQKPVNPTFDLIPDNLSENNMEEGLSVEQKKILRKLLTEFEIKKIYLESQLNILQVVQMVGTNRSYISALINRQYNQNFCSFVNGFRIQELQRVFIENPDYSNETLAECCGFGSLSSLKRSVYAKTGLTINQWKNQILYGQPAGEVLENQ